jgi:hypothetical protein
MIYEKTDKAGLYRDMETGAIVNCDTTALEAYKKKKARFQEMSGIKARQEKIESDIGELKEMLTHLTTVITNKH